MTESYLTTDIIVIIVLVVVLIVIGLCAFFVHFYWTKIGVAEIWNTTRWSSVRSSVYRTFQRFSQGSSTKFVSDTGLDEVAVYNDRAIDVPYEKSSRANPKITSYVTPANRPEHNPISILSDNNPVRYTYANAQNTYGYNDLASTIQKQRF